MSLECWATWSETIPDLKCAKRQRRNLSSGFRAERNAEAGQVETGSFRIVLRIVGKNPGESRMGRSPVQPGTRAGPVFSLSLKERMWGVRTPFTKTSSQPSGLELAV